MAQTVINLLKDHLLRRISYHCHILAYYLDPLVTEETSSPYQHAQKQKKSSHWDFTFLFPVLALATSTLYGNVLLVILETGSADLDLPAFQHCPVSMYHQVLPRSMWQQSDISYALSSGTALAIYATFLLNPYTAGRYYLTTDTGLQVDGKSKLKEKTQKNSQIFHLLRTSAARFQGNSVLPRAHPALYDNRPNRLHPFHPHLQLRHRPAGEPSLEFRPSRWTSSPHFQPAALSLLCPRSLCRAELRSTGQPVSAPQTAVHFAENGAPKSKAAKPEAATET